jgi:hypothetical protein
VALAVFLCVLCAVAGCLPDPRRSQTIDLLDQLTDARGLLIQVPPQLDHACNVVGDVQTRLFGEPGLVDVRQAWPELRDAAGALQAVCGQDVLLAQPSTDSPAMLVAQQRWRAGVEREMGVACEHLLRAAAALSRPAPCT